LGSDELHRERGYAHEPPPGAGALLRCLPGICRTRPPGLEADTDELADDVREMLSSAGSEGFLLR
jgi:hypothetical protein